LFPEASAIDRELEALRADERPEEIDDERQGHDSDDGVFHGGDSELSAGVGVEDAEAEEDHGDDDEDHVGHEGLLLKAARFRRCIGASLSKGYPGTHQGRLKSSGLPIRETSRSVSRDRPSPRRHRGTALPGFEDGLGIHHGDTEARRNRNGKCLFFSVFSVLSVVPSPEGQGSAG
jgi:hypothetical protein